MVNGVNGQTSVKENVFAGIVGAFLFSLAGGIVWFLLWQIGFIAGISGIIGVVCAIKGYSVFAKKESVKGVIISVILTIIVMAIAWYFCLSMDVYNAYKEWYAEGYVDFTVKFGEAVRIAYMYLEEPDIAFEYIKSLVIGLAFCVVGGIGYVTGAVKRVKAAKACSSASACEAEYTERDSSSEPYVATYNDSGYTHLNGEVEDFKGNE